MSQRLKPWRAKPPQEVAELIHRVPNTRLYLIQRSGPTSFILREEGSEKKHKVMLGSTPSCSCSPGSSSGGCKEVCLHILFVMIKVLRVPPSNPLVWQLYLNDRELDEVLRCTNAPQVAERAKEAMTKAQSKSSTEVDRKPLSEEEPCPICYDDMTASDDAELVHCRYSCGNSVHGRCMRVWSDHQQTISQALSCPLCRGDWGDFTWRPIAIPKKKKPPANSPALGTTHFGTRCAGCRAAPISGKRFRCLVCADLSLCEGCFQAGQHPQHPMACKETPSSSETMGERESLMPSATSLAETSTSQATGGSGATSMASGAAGPSPARRRTNSLAKKPSDSIRHRRGNQGPDTRTEAESSQRGLGLENLLGVGPAAGLGDTTGGSEGSYLCGGALSPRSISHSGGEAAGPQRGWSGRRRAQLQNGLTSRKDVVQRSDSMPGPSGLLPMLDITGGFIGQRAMAHEGTGSLPARRSKRAAPTGAGLAELGANPAAQAGVLGMEGLNGTSILGQAGPDGLDMAGPRNMLPMRSEGDFAEGGADRTRRLSHTLHVPQVAADLPSLIGNAELQMTARLAGLSLRRESDCGDEPSTSMPAARFSDGGGVLPGETLGGRVASGRRQNLPSIRRGSTMKAIRSGGPLPLPPQAQWQPSEQSLCNLVIARVAPDAPAEATSTGDDSAGLSALCIGSSKPPTKPRQRASILIKAPSKARKAGLSVSDDPAAWDATDAGEVLLVQGLDAPSSQTQSYLALLDNFFEGPEFDPTFGRGAQRSRSSGAPDTGHSPLPGDSFGSHTLSGSRPSIPVIVTKADTTEWQTVLSSPTGPRSCLPKPQHDLRLSCSLDSPGANLPRWMNSDSFDDLSDWPQQ